MADDGRDQHAPGWKRDPWRRHAGRYWDGGQWTEHVVSTARVTSIDPVPSNPPPVSPPPLPPVEPSPPRQTAPAPVRAVGPPSSGRSGWRPMTWVVLAFNVLMVVWIGAGLVGVSDNCADEVGSALEACEAGTAIGASIGVAFLVMLWALGDVILGVIWLVTRKSSQPGRTCPLCGTAVPVGQLVCSGCGYDYRTSQQGALPERPAIWPPPNVTERRKR